METKKCSVCGEEKLIMDFFYKGKDNKCKVCRLAYNRERYSVTIAPSRKKYTYKAVDEKVCKNCGVLKSVSEFSKNRHTGCGPSVYKDNCKSCARILRDRVKESQRAAIYRGKTIEERREKKRLYLSNPENLEKARKYAREYHKKNPHRQRIRILAQYGLTEEGYDELLKNQNGACAICGKGRNEMKSHLVVDHDHKTGKVRGLLCVQCNTSLGNLKDQTDLLKKAAEYLDSFNNSI